MNNREQLTSEEAEILKATGGLKLNQFQNAGNNVFTKPQPTHVEDQKPPGLSLEERMAQNKRAVVAQLMPSADSNPAANEFLKTPSSELSSSAQASQEKKKRLQLSTPRFPFSGTGGQSVTASKSVANEESKTKKNEKSAPIVEKIDRQTLEKTALENSSKKNEKSKKEELDPFLSTQIDPFRISTQRDKLFNIFNGLQETEELNAQRQKIVEEKLQKEVKTEIVHPTRAVFAAALENFSPSLKETRFPENLQVYPNREIMLNKEEKEKRDFYGSEESIYWKQIVPEFPMREEEGYERGSPFQPNPYKYSFADERGFERSEKVLEPPQQEIQEGRDQRGSFLQPIRQPENCAIFVKPCLTQQEIHMKKLNENVNVFTFEMKGDKDREGAFRKDLKFNLDVITSDDFDVIQMKMVVYVNGKPHVFHPS